MLPAIQSFREGGKSLFRRVAAHDLMPNVRRRGIHSAVFWFRVTLLKSSNA